MLHRKQFKFREDEDRYIPNDETIKRQCCVDIIRGMKQEELEKLFSFRKTSYYEEITIEASIQLPD